MEKNLLDSLQIPCSWARDEALLTSLHDASAQGTPEDNVGLFCQLARESGSAAMSVEEPLLVA